MVAENTICDIGRYLWCSMVFAVHLAKVSGAATSPSHLGLSLKSLVHIPASYVFNP